MTAYKVEADKLYGELHEWGTDNRGLLEAALEAAEKRGRKDALLLAADYARAMGLDSFADYLQETVRKGLEENWTYLTAEQPR